MSRRDSYHLVRRSINAWSSASFGIAELGYATVVMPSYINSGLEL